MSVKPHPKWPGFWIIRYYPEGRKIDKKTGRPGNKETRVNFEGTKAEAQALHEKLVAARHAKEPVAIEILPTIGEAYFRFAAHYRANVSATTYRDFVSSWNQHLEPFFGPLRPAYLTATVIDEYKSHRLGQKDLRFKDKKAAKPPKKKTINKELSYLSAMITWMSDKDQRLCPPLSFIIKGYPAKQVKAPLPVVPSRTEMVKLFRAAERQYRPLWIICYYGGLRKTEGTKLEGRHINWSQGYMLITGKGDKERIVPIHDKSRVYLRKHCKPGYLFINPKTHLPWVDFKKALRRAADKAKIGQHVYMHLLRHGFGVHSIQSGINPRSLQMMLGHADLKTTERYTTLAAQHLQEEMKRFGRKRNAE